MQQTKQLNQQSKEDKPQQKNWKSQREKKLQQLLHQVFIIKHVFVKGEKRTMKKVHQKPPGIDETSLRTDVFYADLIDKEIQRLL